MLPAFTPSYAAPEQWGPSGSGRPVPGPTSGGSRSPCSRRSSVARRSTAITRRCSAPPSIRRCARRRGSLGMTVSDAVEAVFLKALAVDPRDRYLTIADFYAELRRPSARPRPAPATGARHRRPRLRADAAARVPGVAATERPDPRPEQATAAAVPALAPIPGLRPRPEPVAPLPAEPPSRGTKDTLAVVERFTQLVDPAPWWPRARRAAAGPPAAGRAAAPGGHERPGAPGASRGRPRARPARRPAARRAGPPARALPSGAGPARAAGARGAGAQPGRTGGGRNAARAALATRGAGRHRDRDRRARPDLQRLRDALPELPLRPLWVAGPLVFMGLSLGLYRLFLTDE
jgi:hypothetical protein